MSGSQHLGLLFFQEFVHKEIQHMFIFTVFCDKANESSAPDPTLANTSQVSIMQLELFPTLPACLALQQLTQHLVDVSGGTCLWAISLFLL